MNYVLGTNRENVGSQLLSCPEYIQVSVTYLPYICHASIFYGIVCMKKPN